MKTTTEIKVTLQWTRERIEIVRITRTDIKHFRNTKKKKNLNEQKPRLKRLERKLQKLYPDKENQIYAKSIRIEKVHIFK